MKYKTLIRKSDGQCVYVKRYTGGVFESKTPIECEDDMKELFMRHFDIDWSLYDLITVEVRRTDETCKWEKTKDYPTALVGCRQQFRKLDKDYEYCPFCGNKIERV